MRTKEEREQNLNNARYAKATNKILTGLVNNLFNDKDMNSLGFSVADLGSTFTSSTMRVPRLMKKLGIERNPYHTTKDTHTMVGILADELTVTEMNALREYAKELPSLRKEANQKQNHSDEYERQQARERMARLRARKRAEAAMQAETQQAADQAVANVNNDVDMPAVPTPVQHEETATVEEPEKQEPVTAVKEAEKQEPATPVETEQPEKREYTSAYAAKHQTTVALMLLEDNKDKDPLKLMKILEAKYEQPLTHNDTSEDAIKAAYTAGQTTVNGETRIDIVKMAIFDSSKHSYVYDDPFSPILEQIKSLEWHLDGYEIPFPSASKYQLPTFDWERQYEERIKWHEEALSDYVFQLYRARLLLLGYIINYLDRQGD